MKDYLLIALSLILVLSGCTNVQGEILLKEKPVLITVLKHTEKKIEMNYLGIAEPFEIKKYAFLTGGVLESINVGVGDNVERDKVLATLQNNKLSIAASASEEQTKVAELAYAKAKQAFNYYDKLLNDTKALLDVGATSGQTYDEVKLKRDVAYKELSQAGVSIEQARLKTKYDRDNVADAILSSDIEGTVLEVLYKKGEVVPQGYPVVIIRSNQNIIKVGLTADDVKLIKKQETAYVTLSDNKVVEAKINHINFVPDQNSRTYAVELLLGDSTNLLVGESVNVSFVRGKKSGIWLTLGHILNDGQDYVYIVKDGRAKRIDLQILAVHKDFVLVDGLSAGDKLITSGTSSLSDGYKTTIKESVEDDKDE